MSIHNSFIYKVLILCVEYVVVGQKRSSRNRQKTPPMQQNLCRKLGKKNNVLGVVVVPNKDTDGTVCFSTMCDKCYCRLQNLK